MIARFRPSAHVHALLAARLPAAARFAAIRRRLLGGGRGRSLNRRRSWSRFRLRRRLRGRLLHRLLHRLLRRLFHGLLRRLRGCLLCATFLAASYFAAFFAAFFTAFFAAFFAGFFLVAIVYFPRVLCVPRRVKSSYTELSKLPIVIFHEWAIRERQSYRDRPVRAGCPTCPAILLTSRWPSSV